jgi:hypothetical protein
MRVISENFALPAPAPPVADPMVIALVEPEVKDNSCVSFSCPLIVLSPSISLQKKNICEYIFWLHTREHNNRMGKRIFFINIFLSDKIISMSKAMAGKSRELSIPGQRLTILGQSYPV